MKPSYFKAIPCLLAFAISQQAMAQPPKFVDARSFAMGGVGVASSTPTSAMFFNPALMAANHLDEHDDFGIVLPSFHVRIADEQEVSDQIDDIQDLIDEFEKNLDEIETTQNSGGKITDELRQRAIQNAKGLNQSFADIDDDPLRLDLGLGMGFVFPSHNIAWGIMANTSIRTMVSANYEDFSKFDKLITELENDLDISDTNTDLASDGRLIAAAQTQVGLALATQFDISGHPLMVGVTPKFVSIDTYHYVESMTSFDQDNEDDGTYETYERTFNMDLGVAYQFGETNQWTAGLAILDLIPMEIDTLEYDVPLGTSGSRHIDPVVIEYNPTVRVGLAHRSEWHTIAVDLDLTKNEGFIGERDEQWLAIGGEFDAWDTVQLRAGIRQNIASDNAKPSTTNAVKDSDTQVTAGFGLSPFGVRIDVSALASNNEVGAAAELGFAF